MLTKSLSNHFVFGQLTNDREITMTIIENFICCEVAQGQFLIEQGNNASAFFVLEKGLL